MKKHFNDIKCLLVLYLVLFAVFILTSEHQGNLIIDCGREVFYPLRILDGSVLYKDLFNIYGPFAYLFNALLYKIFSIHLNTLYIAGMFTAAGICTFIYLISRLFFDKLLSFAITFLTIILGCLSFYIFNFSFPYAFAITYGMLAFLVSLYFLLLFFQKNSTKLYYLSAFFAGVAILCKYEFLPYLLIYIFAEYKLGFNFKRIIIAILNLLIMPLIIFGYLFSSGLSVSDLIENLKDIYAMTRTSTLKYFYIVSGLHFQKETLGILIRNFLKSSFPLFVFFSGLYLYKKSTIKAVALIVLSTILLINWVSVEYFIFLPLLLLILILFLIKKQDICVQVLSLSALLVSLKVFWATPLNSYGLFFIPILLIAVICYTGKNFRKQTAIYLIILALIFAGYNLKERKYKSVPVQSDIGIIYANYGFKESAQNIVDYINNNTKNTDRILIFPEGLFINFMALRKSDDYYNSLIPLYIETFGEDRIMKHFENNKPEYIILHNFPTTDYYFQGICKDYALEFCNFVQKEYKLNHVIDGDFRAYIFERK